MQYLYSALKNDTPFLYAYNDSNTIHDFNYG